MRFAAPILLAVGLVLSQGVAESADSLDTRQKRARELYLRAQERIGSERIDYRRQAIGWLEEATLLEPDNPRYQMALGMRTTRPVSTRTR